MGQRARGPEQGDGAPRVSHPWPYVAIRARPWHTQQRRGGCVGRSSQTSLETTNHEMQLSAPAQPGLPGTPHLASPATPGRAKTRARTVVPAVDVPCPRALLQDLPQVAPGPNILTALAGVATHYLAVGWAD
jgi:hypothetical protein